MIPYRYPWLYSLALSMLLAAFGYFYDLEKKCLYIAELRQEEKNLIKELTGKISDKQDKNRSVTAFPVFKKNELTAVSTLLKLAAMQGLSIPFIHSENNGALHRLLLQITLEGDVEQIFSFIQILEKQKDIKINNFALRLSNQYLLHLEMKLWLPLSFFIKPALPVIEQEEFNNPFCKSQNGNDHWFHSAVDKLQFYPIRLIKMAGYLQQNQRVQALILLPNNEFAAIYAGAIIGKEQAKVIAIQPDKIKVQEKGKQAIFLPMLPPFTHFQTVS